jgi:hypothetical protein
MTSRIESKPDKKDRNVRHYLSFVIINSRIIQDHQNQIFD